jgi:outer membrane protein assembly factor BamB
MAGASRYVIRIGALAITLALGGCGSWTSLSTYNPMNWFGWGSKKLPELPALKSNVAGVVWSAHVGKAGGYLLVPALSDKLIYATGHAGDIYALSEDGGRTVSRFDAKADITGGVGVADNMVVVANTKGDVLAFDAAGRSMWKNNIGGEVLAAPVVSLASVIVRTADGRIFALDRVDGKRKWVFTRPTPALTLRTNAGVAISRGAIYAGYPGGKMVSLELDTGKPIWEGTISQPRGATELERIADVGGAPFLDDSRICAAVYQGRTGCLETLSGNLLWSRDISSAGGVVVDAKNLYVADAGGNVYALDKTSGATVWKQDKLAHREPSTPLVVRGKVVVGDAAGQVHILSAENGDLIGRAVTDGSRVLAVVESTDRAVVQTDRGGIFAISIK